MSPFRKCRYFLIHWKTKSVAQSKRKRKRKGNKTLLRYKKKQLKIKRHHSSWNPNNLETTYHVYDDTELEFCHRTIRILSRSNKIAHKHRVNQQRHASINALVDAMRCIYKARESIYVKYKFGFVVRIVCFGILLSFIVFVLFM